MVKKCKLLGLAILVDIDPRETSAHIYRLFIAELFAVMKSGNNLYVLQWWGGHIYK